MTTEELLKAAYRRKHNVALIYDPSQEDAYTFGVRLTPWGKNPDSLMVYGPGGTVAEAAAAAFAAADNKAYEDLDFDFRGWTADE